MAVVELPRHFGRINFSFPIRCWLISYVPDLGPLHRTTVIGDAPRSGACSVFAPGRPVELMREEVHEGADFRREWLLFRKYRGDDVPFGLEGAKDFDELAALEARMSIVSATWMIPSPAVAAETRASWLFMVTRPRIGTVRIVPSRSHRPSFGVQPHADESRGVCP
jgi:hypothetical protein